jgi:hypothetical protein
MRKIKIFSNIKKILFEDLTCDSQPRKECLRDPVPVKAGAGHAVLHDQIWITEAMQNPRTGSVVDWAYMEVKQPGILMYQNPSSFLQNGDILENSGQSDKAPFITEMLNKYRNEFYTLATGYLESSGLIGDYHEYGCYSATTFRMALTNAALFGLIERDPEMRFHAFDSFEGLPALSPDLAETSNWAEGSMAMSEMEFWAAINAHGLFEDRIATYPGFFDRSLSDDLQRRFIASGKKISFVNVDCDLYESAIPVFEFIGPLLQQGSLLYLDDWYCGYKGSEKAGVARAFFEFRDSTGIRCTPFKDCGWWGKSFIVQENPLLAQ